VCASLPAEPAQSDCVIWRSDSEEVILDGLLTCGRRSGGNPDGHRSGSLREVGLRESDRDWSRLTGKPEVIRKRTLDRIGGFRPAKRDVVQKSASRRSPLISSKRVSRAFVDHDPDREGFIHARASTGTYPTISPAGLEGILTEPMWALGLTFCFAVGRPWVNARIRFSQLPMPSVEGNHG
jgi:hypothetical protein